MEAFAWLSEIFNGLLSFIPRPVIVRATHGGVKWRLGKKVREMVPGWHWYWPLTTEIEVIVTARQTHDLPSPQAVETRDGVSVAVGSLIVYSINDIVQAIGERNWDVDSTVNDITKAAIVGVVSQWDYSDLRDELTDTVEKELTAMCRKHLRQFGVYVHRCAVTDFSHTTVRMLFGLQAGQAMVEDE